MKQWRTKMNAINETWVNGHGMNLLYSSNGKTGNLMNIGQTGRNLNRTGIIGRAFQWLKELKYEISNADISFEPLIDFPRDI
jgi:hypothetical protein